MRLGAHVSAAGGLPKAVDRAVELGAECLQLFVSSPQAWRPARHVAQEVAEFLAKLADRGIGPVFVHTIYLLNLSSRDPILRARSIASLGEALYWAGELGASGTITHLGSGLGLGENAPAEEAVAEALSAVLVSAPGESRIVLETSAGSTIGGDFGQIGRIIRLAGDRTRLKVCLDTAHVFAAGHDFRTAPGLRSMFQEFDREIGLSNLVVVHANDSKSQLGSRVDRHENIGFGHIGELGFRRLLRHPALEHVPFILEVPGMAKSGPDKENMAVLRRLAGQQVRKRMIVGEQSRLDNGEPNRI